MDCKQSIEYINERTLDEDSGELNEIERKILRASWEGASYEEIASNIAGSKYSTTYIKTLGSKLWAKITEAVGQDITKTNFRKIFEQVENPADLAGDSIPISQYFYGRVNELSSLNNFTQSNRCVLLSGQPGAGKSVMAAKLITSLECRSQWRTIVWINFIQTDTSQSVLGRIHRGLRRDQSDDTFSTATLLTMMEAENSLIVLDVSPEKGSIFDDFPLDELNVLKNIFISPLVMLSSKSCLLVVSEIAFPWFRQWEIANYRVSTMILEGLDIASANALLKQEGITGEESWPHLIQTHAYNPLSLKLVSRMIRTLFDGDASQMGEQTIIPADAAEVFSVQFQMLPDQKKQIARIMATTRELRTLNDIAKQLIEVNPEIQIEELHNFICDYVLVERWNSPDGSRTLYRLHPSLRRYIERNPGSSQ